MYDDILGPPPKKAKEPKTKINLKSGESVSSSDAPEELELDIEDLELEMEDSNPVDPGDIFPDDDEDEDMWDLGFDDDGGDECDCGCEDCSDEGC